MAGWYVNRAFEALGIIPRGVTALDDLVLDGDHDKLARSLATVLHDGVGDLAARPEPTEAILAELQSWSIDEMVNLLWALLKHEPEEEQKRYIPGM